MSIELLKTAFDLAHTPLHSKRNTMIAIIGAAGKVGFATAQALRQANVPVRAILRDAAKADRLKQIGCEIAMADLLDCNSLANAIANCDSVQIILPTPFQAKDGAQEMQSMIDSLATALEQAKPKSVLAISDYGAHVSDDIGMPTMFRSLEERLSRISGQKIFLRSAPHMQNWGRSIPAAIDSGTLSSFYDPLDMPLPTISAPDLGLVAADLLLGPTGTKELEIFHAEGPHRYSANEVASALSEILGRPIKAEVVPRSQWTDMLESLVSPSLATLLIKANDAQNEGGLVEVEQDNGEVRRGTTELIDALRPVVSPT